MSVEAELRNYMAALERMGVDPAPLAARAEAVAGVADSGFEEALRDFDAAAGSGAYHVPALDADFGALLLEALADRCLEAVRKRQLYGAARARAAIFASYATSGGEGLARMQDVDRIDAKLEGARS